MASSLRGGAESPTFTRTRHGPPTKSSISKEPVQEADATIGRRDPSARQEQELSARPPPTLTQRSDRGPSRSTISGDPTCEPTVEASRSRRSRSPRHREDQETQGGGAGAFRGGGEGSPEGLRGGAGGSAATARNRQETLLAALADLMSKFGNDGEEGSARAAGAEAQPRPQPRRKEGQPPQQATLAVQQQKQQQRQQQPQPQNTSKQPKKQQEDVVDPFRRLISAIKKVVAKAEAAPDPLAYPLVDRLARVVQAAQAGRPVEKPKPASRRSAAKASNGSKEGGGAAGAQPKTAGGGRPPQQPQPPPTAGGQQTAHAGVVRGRGRRRRQEGEEAATTATMAKDSPAQQRSSQPARRAESGGLLAAGWPPAAVCASGRMLEALCEAKPPPGSVAVMSTEDADMATDLARTHWVKTTFAILVPGAEADEAEHPKARRFAVASADGVACGPFVVWPFVGEALPLFPPEPVVSTATVTARELLTVRFCGVRPCSFLGEFTGEASGRLTSRGGAADVAAPLR